LGQNIFNRRMVERTKEKEKKGGPQKKALSSRSWTCEISKTGVPKQSAKLKGRDLDFRPKKKKSKREEQTEN